jgi:hypothetical protein
MATTARTPVHLWIVGILALLWNGFGCYDYFMTQSRGADYIRQMMPANADAIMAYINGLPAWATGAWALGVWGGLLGAILLLARSRWAVPALGVSFIGALVGIGYQLLNPAPVADMHEGVNGAMPYVIIVVALALFLYARAMKTRGVLR